MNKIELSNDELYFLEKLCDDQQGLLMRDTPKIGETFFLLNTMKDKLPSNDLVLKSIVKKLEEEARTTLLIDGLRKKFENLRNENENIRN